MTEATATPAASAPRWRFWVFVLVMLGIAIAFAGLGKWQLDRQAWKDGLIAEVSEHMHEDPVALPPAGAWATLDPQSLAYRSVTVSGHYLPDQSVRVFVGLSDAKGQYSGPGYWIMTPFAVDGGGTVFVDRGFVPQDRADDYVTDKTAPAGAVTLTGVAVGSEEVYPFTPAPDAAHRIDWLRNVARLAKLAPTAPQPFAPIFIDLPAGPRGALPQGGETSVDFPDNHLGYAATWFGFCLTTLIMLAEWVRRQRMRRQPSAS